MLWRIRIRRVSNSTGRGSQFLKTYKRTSDMWIRGRGRRVNNVVLVSFLPWGCAVPGRGQPDSYRIGSSGASAQEHAQGGGVQMPRPEAGSAHKPLPGVPRRLPGKGTSVLVGAIFMLVFRVGRFCVCPFLARVALTGVPWRLPGQGVSVLVGAILSSMMLVFRVGRFMCVSFLARVALPWVPWRLPGKGTWVLVGAIFTLWSSGLAGFVWCLARVAERHPGSPWHAWLCR